MKPIISCLLLLSSVLSLNGQSIYYDAVELSNYLEPIDNANTIAKLSSNPDSQSKYYEILLRYVDYDELQAIDEAINDGFFGNPFMSDQQGTSLILLPDEFHSIAILENRDLMPPPKATGTEPSMFVSNLANALANFFVNRTKVELSMAFFRDFQRKVDENPYLKPLFPETATMLKLIDTEIYQFNIYMGSLREAFGNDLKVLPTNLKLALETEGWLKDKPELDLLVSDLMGLTQLMMDGEKASELVHYLGSEGLIQDPVRLNSLPAKYQIRMKNLAASFQVMDLISISLQNQDQDLIWVDINELKSTFKKQETLYIYLALLYQKGADITFTGSRSFQSMLGGLAQQAGQVEQFRKQLIRFTQYGEGVRESIRQISGEIPRDSVKYEAYFQMVDNFVGLLNEGISFRRLIIPDSECDTVENEFITNLQLLCKLNLNIRQKQYSLAVMNLSYILEKYLGKDKFKQKHKDAFMKYGMFIATVAECDDSEQMEQAIEAFALPPGSSSLKKHAKFSVSLNGYTGLSGGFERLQVADTEPNGIASISAPLGIGLNFGLKRSGSISFYTSVIDVGAITAYRFNDENTDDLPALSWQNIIAPGAFLIYGFGKDLPISLGLGAQMGPNLRKVTNAQIAIQEDRGWRMVGFISVDIPVAHFYTQK